MTIASFRRVLGVFCVLALLGLSGFASVDDAEFEVEFYCANVASGVWPDYTNSYKDECKDSLPSR